MQIILGKIIVHNQFVTMFMTRDTTFYTGTLKRLKFFDHNEIVFLIVPQGFVVIRFPANEEWAEPHFKKMTRINLQK